MNETSQQATAMLEQAGILRQPARGSALARAIEHSDWERAALLLLIAVTTAVRALPQDTIDDVFALIDAAEGEA